MCMGLGDGSTAPHTVCAVPLRPLPPSTTPAPHAISPQFLSASVIAQPPCMHSACSYKPAFLSLSHAPVDVNHSFLVNISAVNQLTFFFLSLLACYDQTHLSRIERQRPQWQQLQAVRFVRVYSVFQYHIHVRVNVDLLFAHKLSALCIRSHNW